MPPLAPTTIIPGSLARNVQPTLIARDGLVLRPWRGDDAPVVRSVYGDAEIRRWHVRSVESDAEAAAIIAGWQAGWSDESRAEWAVTDAAGVVLARAALKTVDLRDGDAEVAYWTVPASRGRGAAPRAVEAVSSWAFATGFRRLHLEHSTRNTASCRVAAKSGFELEGTLRGSARHADGWHDMHVHGRLAGP
ncbi:GNAT family N-acetyltransferase [Isoptericola aurantiacus]|uniref:GNAT family N-acetyltransferase n=1 Tax=Isoptericola aurantiacus TaxID=3377839 RepID=UPI00383A6A33